MYFKYGSVYSILLHISSNDNAPSTISACETAPDRSEGMNHDRKEST